MPDAVPVCPNFKAGSCPQSEVFIARETDNEWVFGCRGCNSINVFPKDHAEGRGRYDAYLKHLHARQQQERHESMKRAFSIPGGS